MVAKSWTSPTWAEVGGRDRSAAADGMPLCCARPRSPRKAAEASRCGTNCSKNVSKLMTSYDFAFKVQGIARPTSSASHGMMSGGTLSVSEAPPAGAPALRRSPLKPLLFSWEARTQRELQGCTT